MGDLIAAHGARETRAMNGNHADNRGEIVKRILLVTAAVLLAIPAIAEPFVSGSEPGWGEKMSPKQRRMAGFDDVRTALKHNHKPDAPTAGVPGYAFNVLTFRHGIHGHGGNSNNSGKAPPFMISQIKSEPFGVFATLRECDVARAQKIAELDTQDARFPHQTGNPPVVSSSTMVINSTGAAGPLNGTITTQEYGRASSERKDVTFCEPGIYAPGQGPSLNIAQDLQTTGAATPAAQTTMLEVPPGFVKHWVAPRPFARVIPGDPEAIEILSASGRDFVFKTKADNDRPTNILLVNDDSEVVANLRIVIPGTPNSEVRQGPNGYQVYRKDNPEYVPPKEKK